MSEEVQVEIVQMTEIDDALIDTVKGIIRDKTDCSKIQSVMSLVRLAMEIVEAQPVKGAKQRDIAVKAIQRFVEESTLSDSLKLQVHTMVQNGSLADTIDLVVAATKGQLDINHAKSCITVVLKCLLGCVNKKH